MILLLTLFLCGLTASAQERIRVACVGNSITEGSGLGSGNTYPEQLQALLGANFEVRNYGLGGRTLLRKGDYPYWNEARYQEALVWQPDIVVIKLGTNDSKPQNWQYGAEFVADYVGLVRSFQSLSGQPAVYVALPIPVFEDKWGITESIVHEEILPAVKEVARQTDARIIDLYRLFRGKAELTYDGVHPNAGGAAFLARRVHRAIKKQAAKLAAQ